jgi:hypothetical protein
MSAVSSPGTCPQHIDGCVREKGLKPELFAAKVARSPHLTRAYSLSNSAFNSCSFGVQFPEFWSLLACARFLEVDIGLFIWAQNKHIRFGLGALIMKRTSSTHRKRKPDQKARLPMPIKYIPPISTGLPGRTDHPFGLRINEKVAVVKTFRRF